MAGRGLFGMGSKRLEQAAKEAAVAEHELGGVISGVTEQLVKQSRKPKVPDTRMMQLVAIHRLNGALLSVASYDSFLRLVSRILSPELVDVLVEVVESGEALTFFALRLLVSIANVAAGRRLLLASGVAEVLFGLFRGGNEEHVSMGVEMLALLTEHRREYKPSLFARGGATKVLIGLLERVDADTSRPLAGADVRCNILVLLTRAIDSERARAQMARARLGGVLRALDGSRDSTLRERELIRTLRRAMAAWEKADREHAAASAAMP